MSLGASLPLISHSHVACIVGTCQIQPSPNAGRGRVASPVGRLSARLAAKVAMSLAVSKPGPDVRAKAGEVVFQRRSNPSTLQIQSRPTSLSSAPIGGHLASPVLGLLVGHRSHGFDYASRLQNRFPTTPFR